MIDGACSFQETCDKFTVGHKRRNHHIRISEICKLFIDGTCPEFGHACSIDKGKLWNEKRKGVVNDAT